MSFLPFILNPRISLSSFISFLFGHLGFSFLGLAPHVILCRVSPRRYDDTYTFALVLNTYHTLCNDDWIVYDAQWMIMIYYNTSFRFWPKLILHRNNITPKNRLLMKAHIREIRNTAAHVFHHWQWGISSHTIDGCSGHEKDIIRFRNL